MPIRFSFIVPFHRGLEHLAQCLSALEPLPPTSELIIAADGATDDCRAVAAAHHARVVDIDGPSGPAAARNAASAVALGDVLIFIDADVVVSRWALARMTAIFLEEPRVTAVFGSYDEQPADPGFMSQYKNLSHAFIHRSSATRARTFWAGFGAVRRDAFQMVGGFDERFERPSVEDIDLGYRLTAAGYEIRLEPTLSACHLKHWTLGSVIVSDVRDRGIPWTQLILRHGALHDDLNLRDQYRWSVALSYLALLALAFAAYDRRLLLVTALALAASTVLNHRYYRFFHRTRGASFVARVWIVHTLQHLYNGQSFAIGTALFVAAHYLNVRLPGALPADGWYERAEVRTPVCTKADFRST